MKDMKVKMINKYAGLTIKQIPTEQYVKNALSSTLKEIKKKASTLSLDPYNNDYAQNDIQSFKESVRSDIDGCVEMRKEEARLLRSKQQNELRRVNREVKQIEADIADYEKEEGRRAASKLNGALRPIPGWAIYLVLVFCICYDAFNVYSKDACLI